MFISKEVWGELLIIPLESTTNFPWFRSFNNLRSQYLILSKQKPPRAGALTILTVTSENSNSGISIFPFSGSLRGPNHAFGLSWSRNFQENRLRGFLCRSMVRASPRWPSVRWSGGADISAWILYQSRGCFLILGTDVGGNCTLVCEKGPEEYLCDSIQAASIFMGMNFDQFTK